MNRSTQLQVRLAVALLLSLALCGCISDSAKFERSPCAGCDFVPVYSVQTG